MENLEKAIGELKHTFPGTELREEENMCNHSSFKIGGPVRAMAFPKSEDEFIKICSVLRKYGNLPMVLGNGSNILFPDEGLKDLFIISTERLNELTLLEENLICAGAGVSLAKLSGFAAQNSLSGLEFASGIPGSLGGGCVMNAGAYGGELKDCVESVKCYDLKSEKILELKAEECEFEYRGSLFKERGDYAVLRVKLRLKTGSTGEILEKMREFNQNRREKQPLDLPSAGSAFKRPEGSYAAALIDRAGLKGYTVGGAQVSEKHAGFIVNTGKATACDVRELFNRVEEKVLKTSGVRLEPEVIILNKGFKKEC